MRTRAGGPAVGLSALAALSLLTACGSAQGAPAASLRLFEHDTQQATIDLGERGAGQGDLFVFSGDLFDGGPTGPKLGRADGSCTTTSGNPNTPGVLLCSVTFRLAGGQIEAQTAIDSGPFFSGAVGPVAVTGGTGAYRDVGGDGTAQVPDAADPSAVLFVLDPKA